VVLWRCLCEDLVLGNVGAVQKAEGKCVMYGSECALSGDRSNALRSERDYTPVSSCLHERPFGANRLDLP